MKASIASLAVWLASAVAKPNGRFVIPLASDAPLEKRSTGDNAIRPFPYNDDWITSANLGGQNIRLQIDTGSSMLWTVTTLISQDTRSANLSSNRIYDPSKSSSWATNGKNFNVSYGATAGENFVAGPVGTETVNIGGATVTMAIGAASSYVGSGMVDSTYDGLVGLAPTGNRSSSDPSKSGNDSPSFIDAIKSQLDAPVFTCNLRKGHPQSLAFGFVNSSLYFDTLKKVPIDLSQGYWTALNTSLSSGSKQIGNSSGASMVLDTGGAFVSLDGPAATDYWSQVPDSSYNATENKWVFPCSTQTLPDLTFNFTTVNLTATVKGAQLNYSARALRGSATGCVGGVQNWSRTDSWNSGPALFSTFFTVWNISEPSFSFAPYSDVDDLAAINNNLVNAAPGLAPAGGAVAGLAALAMGALALL